MITGGNMHKVFLHSTLFSLILFAIFSFSASADISDEKHEELIPHFTEAVKAAEERIAVIESIFHRENEKVKRFGTGLFVNQEGGVITSVTTVAGADQIFVKRIHTQRQPVNIHAINQPLGLVLLKTPFEVKIVEEGEEQPAIPGEWLLITYAGRSGAEESDAELNLFPVILSANKSSVNILGTKHYPLLKLNSQSPSGSAAAPVFNTRGTLEGIILATKECPKTSFDCSYALGREKLYEVSREMESGISHRMGWLGLALQKVDLPDYEHGVQVTAVMRNYPADKAGIKPGDIILSVDGELITKPAVIQKIIANSSPGREVELLVVQNGETNTLNIALEARPLLISIEP